MPALLLYSFKLSVCLGIIYMFYRLFLRNITFFNWNRWYLLAGTGLSFLFPLVNIIPSTEHRKPIHLQVIRDIPTLNNLYSPVFNAVVAPDSLEENLYRYIPFLFGLGILVQVGKLTIQFLSFFRLRQSATSLQNGDIEIYQVDKKIAPFSFGNAIFLNKNLLQPTELQEIIRHELVHINQKHTIDVLWLEFICLVNWYNPFAWLIKQAARQNLEFIADSAVLKAPSSDKKHYQYLLLKVIGLPDLKIANQFNISSLKTRIKMMNRMQSTNRELARFLLVLPMLATLLWACQDNEDTSLKDLSSTQTKSAVDKPGLPEAPPPPPPLPEPPAPGINQTPGEAITVDSFLKRNPEIKYFSPILKNNSITSVEVELKSGKKENYNFKNEAELAQFHQRYGYFPMHSPPPPPPPLVKEVSEDHKLFMKRNPQVEFVGWQGEETMVVFYKTGEREEYDLKTEEGKAKAEKKYGKLPKYPI